MDEIYAASPTAIIESNPGDLVYRIRTENGSRVLCTVKERTRTPLVRKEVEFELPDKSTGQQLMELLGVFHQTTVTKTRQEWTAPGALVLIDDVLGLGVFVELEILSDNVSASDLTLDRLRTNLGLKDEDLVDAPYDAMQMRLGKE